jgi:hypothetical protein
MVGKPEVIARIGSAEITGLPIRPELGWTIPSRIKAIPPNGTYQALAVSLGERVLFQIAQPELLSW